MEIYRITRYLYTVSFLSLLVVCFATQVAKNGYDILIDPTLGYKCGSDFDILDCSGRDLYNISPEIIFPDGVHSADFGNNKIKGLVSGTFFDGPETNKLEFANNAVDFLSSSVFSNLTRLVTLVLSHNKIYELPVDVFEGLEELLKLDLSFNRINDFDPDIFKYSKKLKELNLRNNQLMTLRDNAFVHLSFLTHLELENNDIIEPLADNLFYANVRLNYLRLSGNPMEIVPIKAIQSARSLLFLDLSSTHLKKIEYKDFEGLSDLTELHLNRIPTLERIGEYAFQDLLKLRRFSSSYNLNLRSLHPKAFASNLSDGIIKLEELTLRHNALTSLSYNTLFWPSLRTVDLSMNPWKCDCRLQFIKSLPLKNESRHQLTCNKPKKYRGLMVTDIPVEDFTCPLISEDVMIVAVILMVIVSAMALTTLGYICLKLSLCQFLSNLISPKKKGGYIRVKRKSDKDGVDLEWDNSAEP